MCLLTMEYSQICVNSYSWCSVKQPVCSVCEKLTPIDVDLTIVVFLACILELSQLVRWDQLGRIVEIPAEFRSARRL